MLLINYFHLFSISFTVMLYVKVGVLYIVGMIVLLPAFICSLYFCIKNYFISPTTKLF